MNKNFLNLYLNDIFRRPLKSWRFICPQFQHYVLASMLISSIAPLRVSLLGVRGLNRRFNPQKLRICMHLPADMLTRSNAPVRGSVVCHKWLGRVFHPQKKKEREWHTLCLTVQETVSCYTNRLSWVFRPKERKKVWAGLGLRCNECLCTECFTSETQKHILFRLALLLSLFWLSSLARSLLIFLHAPSPDFFFLYSHTHLFMYICRWVNVYMHI